MSKDSRLTPDKVCGGGNWLETTIGAFINISHISCFHISDGVSKYTDLDGIVTYRGNYEIQASMLDIENPLPVGFYYVCVERPEEALNIRKQAENDLKIFMGYISGKGVPYNEIGDLT